MESDDIEEFLPAGFLTPKGERCAFSVPPARPGIDVLSHVGMQVHVRPGIQVQAASEEPPPVKKSFSAQVRATARARSALYKLVRKANHILPDNPDNPDNPDIPETKVIEK